MFVRDYDTQRSILVVDDHPLIRQGLAQVLAAALDGVEVMEAAAFPDALACIGAPGLFLVLVDLSIPGMATPRALELLRRSAPAVKVVVLSGSDDRADMLAALEAGVHGYIVKCDRTDNVVRRIRQVLAGEICVPPSIAELPAPLPTQHPEAQVRRAAPFGELTRRQREVLALVSEGLSNKEIGQRLKVAEGTVKMHVAMILKAIDAKNRAHAAAMGRQVRKVGEAV